jgi:Fe-S oxidoreductase
MNEKGESMCCGGSLGSTGISGTRRDEVTLLALESLLAHHPETIITGCPLCKKTFQKESPVEVKDIGELVAESMVHRKVSNRIQQVQRIYAD